MTEGELRCLGSSLFLKSIYGVGYTLTIIRQDGVGKMVPLGGDADGDSEGLEVRVIYAVEQLRCFVLPNDNHSALELDPNSLPCAGMTPAHGTQTSDDDKAKDLLHEVVVGFVPEALIVSNVGKERNYRLPFASAKNFVGMFREIDSRVRRSRASIVCNALEYVLPIALTVCSARLVKSGETYVRVCREEA